ncbi:MAG: hypothetical protein ACK4NY_12715 [Spirosomataceae bacterium]
MKGIIQLCYRKIIDINSQKTWDKYVFDDTYMEFFMQSQFYNQEGKYITFQEILNAHPEAEKIHFLTSTAAVGYIQQLNEIMPDVLNTHGKLCIPFKNFRFEIIHSNVKSKQEHRVAIYFYSEPITWIDTIDNQLVIAYGDRSEAIQNGELVETEMITLQPFLSIASIKKVNL